MMCAYFFNLTVKNIFLKATDFHQGHLSLQFFICETKIKHPFLCHKHIYNFLYYGHYKNTLEFISNGKVNVYHSFLLSSILCMCFPGGSDGKESACNVGDPGLIPGSGRSPGERNGYPLQNSSLENAMDRGAWWTTVHGVTKSQTQLSN